MTVETETIGARHVAHDEAKSLEKLDEYSKASDWSDVPSEYIKDNYLNTDELEPSDMIGNWFSHDIVDMRVTFSTNKCLHDVQVCTSLNNPTTWVSYDGNTSGVLIIETSFNGDKWQTWARAPRVADYLLEVAMTYRLTSV